MLYLYHGSTSVCAAKVRLVMHEKQLDWSGEILDLQRGDHLRPEYKRINPAALVPALLHDGRVIVESTIIMEYLEDAFSDPSLMPRDAHERAAARLWLKKVDQLHAACTTLTFAIAFRPIHLKKTPAELEARLRAMPDAANRERQRLAIMQGVEAPHVAAALREFDAFIGAMEKTLSASPYLAGGAYSLADAAATPYVNRAELLGLAGLWDGGRPQVADWFARIRARRSFAPAMEEVLMAVDHERFNLPRAKTWEKAQAILALS
jgi:glutathione S-transferase